MPKIYDVFPRLTNKIVESDLSDMKQPLTIKNVEVSGDNKKTVWLDFEDTTLRHRCSKAEVFALVKKFNTVELNDFVDQEVNLVAESGIVKIKIEEKKKEPNKK